MLRVVLLGLGYFIAASATVATTRFGDGVAFVWVANALLFAELSIRPRSSWTAPLASCGLASIVATSLFGFGPGASVPLALVNIGEAYLGATLLRRIRPAATEFNSLDAMFAFILTAGIVAPAVTAFGGALVAELSGRAFLSNWLRWFAGHSLGALTFAPIFTLLLRGDVRTWFRQATPRLVFEAAATLGAVGAAAYLVFSQSSMPLLFLPSLPIIIATFRLGRFGAATSIILLTAIGGIYTAHGLGPIALLKASQGSQLQFLQFYLAITVLTALPVAADLARRKQLFSALRDSEARYRLLTAKSSDIVMNLDVNGCIRFISPSIRMLGGYDPDLLVGSNAADLIHPDDRERVRAVHREALRSPEEPLIVEYRAGREDGAEIWMETHTQGVCEQGGQVTGVVSVVRDVTHRKTLEVSLAAEAKTDPLTGLVNRRAFNQAVAELRSRDEVAIIAVFDIDHFKAVNDRHGHPAGDKVLQSFAKVATEVVRAQDMVARIGGEEFAILLRRTSPDQALTVCERLRRRIEATQVQYGSASISVTVSGGIGYLEAGPEETDPLAVADQALYEAKKNGRNQLRLVA